ncbi:MAG: mechanosensitive ion channel family protein [Planctomycetota bacterium]
MKSLLVLLVLCIAALTSTGQVDVVPPETLQTEAAPEAPAVPEHLRNPRDTMRAFIASMERLLGAPTPAYELRPGLQPSEVLRQTLGIEPGFDQTGVKEVGTRLYGVLHRMADFSGSVDSLPDAARLEEKSRVEGLEGSLPTVIWPWSGTVGVSNEQALLHAQIRIALSRAELQPRIEIVQATDGRWVFSPSTVDGIGEFFDAVRTIEQRFGVATDNATISIWIERHMPEWALRRDFTLRNWQWIGLAVVIFGGFVVDLIARSVLLAFWTRLRKRRKAALDLDAGKRAVRPFGLLIGATIWYWGVAALGLPILWATVLQVAARAVLTLAGILAAWRLTDLLGDVVLSQTRKTSSQVDDLLVPLARKTLKIMVVIFGVVWIANSLNLDIAPVLAGLGVGGLAFAFAAKDTIENLFGSVAVILDRPFQVGDWVLVDGTEGTVEELGLRSTRIRTFYNSQVTVPNAALVRAVVDNYGRRRYRRYKTTLNLTYDTPPDKIEAFCEGLRELVRLHPYTRKDYYHVWMNDFGSHSLDILVYVFFECPEWGTELRERHRFILDILRLANKVGVDFAFPTQTLHLMQAGDAPADNELGDLTIDTERRARRTGLKAAQAMTKDAIWRDVKPAPVAFAAAAQDTADDLGEDGDGDGDGGR